MQFFTFLTEGIVQSPENVRVDFSISDAMKTSMAKLRRIVPQRGVTVPEAADFSDHSAIGHIMLDGGDVPMRESMAAAIARALNTTWDEVIARYSQAYAAQLPVERVGHDLSVLALNRAAYSITQRGGECWLFRDSILARQLEPVDPDLLACAEPFDVTYEAIDSALVTGVREINGRQRGLFNPAAEVNVLISLEHEIPEVRMLVELQAAQQIWRGETRMTADVRIQLGEKPLVLGTPHYDRP